jgi:uncharacterized repeat protein (TIGR02543 family)
MLPKRLLKLSLALAAAAAFGGGLHVDPASALPPLRWCGSDTASYDRKPDARGGRQIHLVYAFPNDGLNRFSSEVASVMASDVWESDTWWRRQDPTRAPRWDTYDFSGGCMGFGALDISMVRLPQPAAHYLNELTRFGRVRVDLLTAGFSNPMKKYLVYYDGPVEDDYFVCGTASGSFADSPDPGYAMVNYGAKDCEDIGDPAQPRYPFTATHELLHALGAVPADAPTNCPGHACDDPKDVMWPSTGTAFKDTVLDVKHDTYYGHSGTWTDIQDSLWLAHLDAPWRQVTVYSDGAPGTISSTDPGIDNCSQAVCQNYWEQGSTVTLTATPKPGAYFRGWGGQCANMSTCTLKIDGDKIVTARFSTPYRLSATVTGDGFVGGSTPGFGCPASCVTDVDSDFTVTLTATPKPGAEFVGWTGACSGSSPTCTVAMTTAKTVGAQFTSAKFTLQVQVSGKGSVVGDAAAFRCAAASCRSDMEGGTEVQLFPKPATGWRFGSWSGACAGKGMLGCRLAMTSEQLVRANFVPVAKPKTAKKK